LRPVNPRGQPAGNDADDDACHDAHVWLSIEWLAPGLSPDLDALQRLAVGQSWAKRARDACEGRPYASPRQVRLSLWHDAASDAALAATVLRAVGVFVAAFMDDQGPAANLGELEARCRHSLADALVSTLEQRQIPLCDQGLSDPCGISCPREYPRPGSRCQCCRGGRSRTLSPTSPPANGDGPDNNRGEDGFGGKHARISERWPGTRRERAAFVPLQLAPLFSPPQQHKT
jgi:hypothetical protein